MSFDVTSSTVPVTPAPAPAPAPAATHFVVDDTGTEVAVDESEFYCPACGRRYEYRQRCIGSPEQPHPPTEVVPTSELQGDEHTPAPVPPGA